MAIAVGDDLALLGDADAAADGAGRLGQDGAVGRAAAASDGAAAAVEQRHHHIVGGTRRGQRVLSLIKLPVGGQIAGVLVAVGVADHDRLPATGAGQVGRVAGMGKERGHHLRRGAQVGPRLEQWREGHPFRPAVVAQAKTMPAGQQQRGQDVLRPVGHTDDIGAE